MIGKLKRILSVILFSFFSLWGFTQVIDLSPDSIRYDLRVPNNQPYIDNFQVVYDAMVLKPNANDAEIWNTMVGSIGTYWDSLDFFYFYAIHTNDNGEACLNWKLPSGGNNIITNGVFDSETDWIIGTGWSITGGKAVATATTDNLTQESILTIGKNYAVTLTISDFSGGTCTVRLGGNVIGTIGTNGTYTYYGIATNVNFILNGGVAFTAKIDNVSCIEWHNATTYNDPTFTAFEGFTGDGSTSYIDLNWNPFIDGINYTLNESSFGIYSRQSALRAEYSGGSADNTSFLNAVTLAVRYSNGYSYGRINEATTFNSSSQDGLGLFILNRTASNYAEIIKNGSSIANTSAAVTGLTTTTIKILVLDLATQFTLYSQEQIACTFGGARLSSTAISAITNAVETALDAKGKGVIP